MQVTETLSDGLKRAYAVVVPAADIERRRASRLSELAKQVNLPGFRPGKVPMPIVKQRYGGAIAAEILEQLINESTQQLMSDRALRPAVSPKLEVVTADPTAPGPAADLEFKLEMEILPDIAMPDFSTFALTRQVAKVPAEEVDKALADLAERNRDLVDFTEEELTARGENQGAAKGDVLTIDYLGKVDGVAFEGGAASGTDVDIGGGNFIPGFVEQLDGLRAGDTKTFEVTFPEDYQAKELAGKVATFDITATKLRKPVPSPIDDSLGEKIGFDSLENLREVLTSMRQRRLDELSRIRMKRSLLDVLAEHATFGPPDVLVDQEFDQIWKNLETSRTNGTLDEDDKAKSEEQLKTDYRAIAIRRVRLGLMLGEIGRINNIQVTPDELTAAIRQEASRYPGQEARMMEFYRGYPAAMDALRGPIFEDKVIDYILDSATVSDVEISIAELEKDPEEAPAGSLTFDEAASGEASPDQAAAEAAAAGDVPVVEAAVVEAAVVEEAVGAAPAAPAA